MFFFSIFYILISQRIRKDGTLSKSSGMQSGGEEEPEDDSHTPLPPPMEIIKDPSTQEEKVYIYIHTRTHLFAVWVFALCRQECWYVGCGLVQYFSY